MYFIIIITMAKESNIIYELPNAIIFFVLMRVDEPQKLS